MIRSGHSELPTPVSDGSQHAEAAVRRLVEELYLALRDGDREELQRRLHPGLRATMTRSLPFGIGGSHVGADAMFTEVWGPTLVHFSMRPEPEEILVVDGRRVVVAGRYEGSARATGRRLDAAFVHLLRFTDRRVSEWRQVTDSAAWITALSPG